MEEDQTIIVRPLTTCMSPMMGNRPGPLPDFKLSMSVDISSGSSISKDTPAPMPHGSVYIVEATEVSPEEILNGKSKMSETAQDIPTLDAGID